ncbi:MAG: hypothetical protein JO314_08215 [Acidobacteria bacterium]|nr:hypothetical protein [Acidobacteriota bacterium]
MQPALDHPWVLAADTRRLCESRMSNYGSTAVVGESLMTTMTIRNSKFAIRN